MLKFRRGSFRNFYWSEKTIVPANGKVFIFEKLCLALIVMIEGTYILLTWRLLLAQQIVFVATHENTNKFIKESIYLIKGTSYSYIYLCLFCNLYDTGGFFHIFCLYFSIAYLCLFKIINLQINRIIFSKA